MRINFHILFFLFSLYNSFAQTEVKFNLATAAVLVPNIGIEIKTTELKSIQLDVLGSFWDSFDGKPYQSLKSLWSTTGIKKKTLFGLHVGFGMFTEN